MTRNALSQLTKRERAIVALIVRGCTDREISARLGIAYSTVRTHVASTYRKLGVNNRVGMAVAVRRVTAASRAAARRGSGHAS